MSDIQHIFQQFGPNYRALHALPLQQLKVMRSIESCRTSALGAHVDECDQCGHMRISYNSCRNRHCPKCQGLVKERWLEDRRQDLLPVGYFHVVFTVPESLNPIALRNQKEVYSIFFRAASETITELAQDKKYLGAQIGTTIILHTWGQNLMFHPHVHCIVTGGGLSSDGRCWVNSRKKFFIPVKVLAKKFRGKFLAYLKKAFRSNNLLFPGNIEALGSKDRFQALINSLYKTNWVVYCKPPFAGPEQVLQYLGRYTHRVAISDNRIIKVEDGRVTFKWKDYKDKSKFKLMTLDAHEFIRRFLMHVLPHKFVKIRHYGILSNRNRNTKLKICKLLLKVSTSRSKVIDTAVLLLKLTGKDITLCPCCGKGNMIRKMKLEPRN
ncbi:IS91 family transposase [Thermincola potens]|uniref:Putative transposase n=1 Tax=Thermincola potens (strain JR) TaxID=635013 RepID=D5XF95_THEPJ|nr:putative transposase [Thermincola potens JR]